MENILLIVLYVLISILFISLFTDGAESKKDFLLKFLAGAFWPISWCISFACDFYEFWKNLKDE
jgi:hypothetical protein